MFQVAARPAAAGAGAMLVRQVMQWYPAIFGMGITPDAERLYKAFAGGRTTDFGAASIR